MATNKLRKDQFRLSERIGSKAAVLVLLLLTLLNGCREAPPEPPSDETPTAPTTLAPETAPPPARPQPPPPDPCPAAVQWHEALEHVGEFRRVIGPVVSTRFASASRGKPTFLNLGKPYPESGRFQVVIWVENRANFPNAPESFYLGKTICVAGLIKTYEGIAEVEADSPEDITII